MIAVRILPATAQHAHVQPISPLVAFLLVRARDCSEISEKSETLHIALFSHAFQDLACLPPSSLSLAN